MKKTMIKKVIFALTLSIITNVTPVLASTNNELLEESSISSRYLEQYSTYWKITSNTVDRTYFGSWRTGPTGLGPGTLSINESTTLNRSFTASITSGKAQVGNSTIGAQLGVTIGKSVSHGTNYSITLNSGERKTIIYRPKITVHKIVQTKYRVNNYTGKTQVLDKQNVYVETFNSWDYSWRNGY